MSDIENPLDEPFQSTDSDSEYDAEYVPSEEDTFQYSDQYEDEALDTTHGDEQDTAPRPEMLTWFLDGWRGFRIPLRDVLTFSLLMAILVAGYALRSEGRNWDDYTHLHPDERHLTQVAEHVHSRQYALDFANRAWASPEDQLANCLRRNPLLGDDELAKMTPDERAEAQRNAGKGGYFDSDCSDLNPDNTNHANFAYGEFSVLSVRILAEVYFDLTTDTSNEFAPTPPWTGYNGIHLVGRTMNAIFDTIVILLVFLIGTRLFNRWTGLLAALFYAFAVFPIQQSHFWTADAFTAFWVVLAIYFAVRVLDDANQYPDRIVPLPWVAMALIVWLWDLQASATVPLESVFVYVGIFGAVGIITSLAVEQKRLPVALTSALIGIVVLLVLANVDLTYSKVFAYNQADKVSIISLPGALGGGIGLLAMTIFWMSGWNKQAAFAGSFQWLTGAFGLWVFDGLAHYDKPSVIPLIVYIVLFTGVAVLSSALRRADSIERQQQLLLFTGIPLAAWGGLAVLVGEVSVWGMLSAFALGILLGASNYWGFLDYTAFGLAFGAAVAGRINVLPLVGVVILAVLLRSLFLMDWRIYSFERNRHLNRVIIGLILAAIASLVAFRFLQPHAFKGPNVYNILPLSKAWLADINTAQFNVSGEADGPPNWQWVNRVPYLYPLQNIILWGLGLPLGLLSWGGFFASLGFIGLGKRQWTRLAIPAAWILVYFGYLGRNWVTTMRYFMPIYGVLAIFAAWALVELAQWAYRGWRLPNVHPRWRYSIAPVCLLFVVVVGHTLIYGIGSNHIHTTQLTRVALSRYAQEFVPGDIGLYIEQPDGNTRMVNLAIRFGETSPQILPLVDGDPHRIQLNPQTSVNLNYIVLNRLGDPNLDEAPEEVRVRIWAEDPLDGHILLGEQSLTTDLGAARGRYGGQYTLEFERPIPLSTEAAVGLERIYFLELEVISGAPVTISQNVSDVFLPANTSHISVFESSIADETARVEELNFETPSVHQDIAYFNPGSSSNYPFTANATGDINSLIFPHVSDPFGDTNPETIRVALCEQAYDQELQIYYCVREVSGAATGDFNTANDGHLLFGPSVTLELDEPFAVEANQSYQLTLRTDDLLGIGGSAVAHEGQWDDPMPTPVCPVPVGMSYRKDLPSGLCRLDTASINLYDAYYIGLEMIQSHEDDTLKQQVILDTLNQADFLTISSNRFYDSFTRIPTRWPMSVRYYEALFSGELGFKLVETFTSFAEFGPFEWKDQVFPSDDLPSWLNEFEAEEAYHVYTHPTTFLFQKTPSYSPERAAEILDVNLRRVETVSGDFFGADTQPVNVIAWPSIEATQSPTAFQFSNEQEAIQREGGTWSTLFDRDAFYNQNQIMSVVVWWGMMVLVGWLVFPLLFYILPGLPDRGFGASKLVAWLLVAWVAWFASSLRIELWNRSGLIGLLLALILFSQGLGYRRRIELSMFIKRRWKHLLIVEGIATLLFVYFIGVRLGNPDLWHSNFGGEKPMNMAYFNGVLRSTIFPAIDPWFSGGYINYYYWGYVLVGAPTKVLGIVPSIAYNLIIPTLFSVTGMGAFSVAYNLVEWSRERRRDAATKEQQPNTDDQHSQPQERYGPAASPYLAGIAALVLAVVLGNLDTPRIFANNVADLGEQTRAREAIEAFKAANERDPSFEEQEQIVQHVEGRSQIGKASSWLSSFWRGFSDVANGDQPLNIPSFHWHWKPTRIINELTNDEGQNIGWNAINEMPYFTFLYGDLHAHMMAMPLTLLVILFLTAEILGAGRGLRSTGGAILALFILAITVGLLRPTNTWDWPTYTILGIVGLTFAAWVGQGRLVLDMPRMPLYQRLRRYLDLRHVFRLWPFLFALPTGVVIRGGLHLFQRMSYENRLEIGDIPPNCLDIDPHTIEQIPLNCEGNLEPFLSISSALMWGIMAFAVVVFLYAVGLVLLGNRFDRRAIMRWVGTLVGFIGISGFAILPYTHWFATPYSKVSAWENDRTPLWAYIDIHGIFLFIVASMLVWQTIRWLRSHRVEQLRGLGVPVLVGIGLVPITLIASLALTYDGLGLGPFPSFLVAFPLFVWLMVMFVLPDQSNVERWVYVLAGLALGLTMGVEALVLEGDNARQNTVFKFYIQAWLLFSIAGGVAIAWMVRAAERWNPKLAGIWQAAIAILLSVGLLYPLTATQARFKDRFNEADTPLTLDGMEFMLYAPHGEDTDGNGPKPGVWFNLSGDYYMIRWLQDHVEGTPTIIEGHHTEYSWSSRISIHTGLPTLLGWRHHQSQQRNLERLSGFLYSRQQNTRAFYTTTDIGAAWDLIEFYDIEYIVVGTFERIIYEDIVRGDDPTLGDRSVRIGMSPGFAKFDVMASEGLGLLEKVYERQVCVHPDIRDVENCPVENISTDYIYHVIPDATYSPSSVAQVSPE